MGDPLARVVIVAVGVAAAVAVAVIGRYVERQRARLAPLVLDGIEARVVLFSDAACRRCDAVREMLRERGADFTEVSFDADPETHRRVGVTAVPLLVVRSGAGALVAQMAGVPSARSLRRALSAVE